MLEQRLENLELAVAEMSATVKTNSGQLSDLITAINGLTAVMSAGKDIAPKQIKEKAEPLQEVEPAKEEAPEATEITIENVDVEDVRKALIELAQAKGKDAAKTLLAEFGAKKVGDLKESDYVNVVYKAVKQEGAA